MLNSDIRTLTIGKRATLLSAFPEINADDWMPEPSENLDLTPTAGEILWSAMTSSEAQQDLLAHPGAGD